MAEERKHSIVDIRRYNGRCQVRTHVDGKGKLVVTIVDPQGTLTKASGSADNSG